MNVRITVCVVVLLLTIVTDVMAAPGDRTHTNLGAYLREKRSPVVGVDGEDGKKDKGIKEGLYSTGFK